MSVSLRVLLACKSACLIRIGSIAREHAWAS